jgi:hypothetical protein
MAEFGPATEQIVLANVIISDDVDRSRFPNCLLGGRAIFSGGDWSGWLPSPPNSSTRRSAWVRVRALHSCSPRTDERAR